MAFVIKLSTEQLIARREELLAELHLDSYEQFRARAELGILRDREWGMRNELDSVAYLLGEDDTDCGSGDLPEESASQPPQARGTQD